jgi:hypothetical protein
MPSENKYGQITTERGNIPPDEPVFLLRAQDPFAVPAIQAYYDRCFDANCDPAHLDGIIAAQDAVARWQGENPDRVKPLPGPQ